MILRHTLPPSRACRHRSYCLVPVGHELVDALLSIQLGVRGPRDGLSHVRVTTYYVQDCEPDPDDSPGRAFLLCKAGEPSRLCEWVPPDPEHVYEILIPWAGRGYCTCDGFRRWGACKHYATIDHLIRVQGWIPGDSHAA